MKTSGKLSPSWLIQRLTPHCSIETASGELMEAFSFGGGLKNGGLSQEAMKLIRGIFSFDYMGSAEFEFGAIPQSFAHIAENSKDYGGFEMQINETPVYVLCDSTLNVEVKKRIQEFSKDQVPLKKYCGFSAELGLDKYSKNRGRYIGWLEIENGFMFFTSKPAYEATANLFSIKTTQQ